MHAQELIEKYQGFIFDMDGTLVDSMPSHLAGWQIAAKEFGFSFDADWFYELGGVPSRKIAQLIEETQQIQLNLDAVTTVKANYFLSVIENATVYPYVKDLIPQLSKVRPLAVGTGAIRKNTLLILENNQILQYFKTITTADDVIHHKPNPDTFLLSAAKMNVKPSECLVFEDTEIGLQAAQAAGMDCILVRKGKPDWDDSYFQTKKAS